MDKPIKLSIPAMSVEITTNQCSPSVKQDVKINIHYFGYNNVNIVTSGAPEYPHQLIVDLDQIKAAGEFFQQIILSQTKKF